MRNPEIPQIRGHFGREPEIEPHLLWGDVQPNSGTRRHAASHRGRSNGLRCADLRESQGG